MEDNMNLDYTPEVNKTRTLDKHPDDLTVGEALKLNLGVMAAFAAVPFVFAGGAVAYDKLSDRYRQWKIKKAEEVQREHMEADIKAHNEN